MTDIEGSASHSYTYGDVAAALDKGTKGEGSAEMLQVLTEISASTTTDPEQCAVLLPIAVDIIVSLGENRAQNAASKFTSTDRAATVTAFVPTADTSRVPG